MTVQEIVKDYLEKNGYDGLCSENCGCGLDHFMPCVDTCSDCQPAYKHICPGMGKCEMSEMCDGGREGDHCYSTEKPEARHDR